MPNAVTLSTTVRVAPERAFDAFVDISDVLSWLADGAVIGRHAEGNWGLGWYADPDSDAGYHSFGTIEVFDPGRSLVVGNLVFSTPEGLEWGPMRLTVEFTPSEGATLVTVRQEDLGDGPEWDGYTTGLRESWERSLESLRAWLEDGRKLPGR